MRIKVSADSTCDLSPELIETYDIGITPLYIVRGEEALRDGIDITPQDIYDYVENSNDVCSTAAVNMTDYAKVFRQWREEYDAIVHFTISSEMSACYQNAVLAASDLTEVYVVDSRNLSNGIGYLAIQAAQLAHSGVEAGEIKRILDERKEKLEVSFVLDTLEYLRKGGRCSTVAALGANILGLKPCIEVKDGKMGVGKKYRGTTVKCLCKYVEDRLKNRDDIDYERMFIVNSGMDPDIVQQVEQKIRELGPFQEILHNKAGCTISNHCGPNCLGIMFCRK
ncbi:MAG: DegV family protein [Oscillospiraceae bacterium]|jgi:DegV family protein with EDD domain